ncbi:hypothetical protein ACC713_36995, partial [Rhizobium johnstonii]|uniref:hypothetical protein n=1 Tax=Rhizobium johnstonii TaxID=3019933 RepID=UPI003F984F6E
RGGEREKEKRKRRGRRRRKKEGEKRREGKKEEGEEEGREEAEGGGGAQRVGKVHRFSRWPSAHPGDPPPFGQINRSYAPPFLRREHA